MKRKVQLFLLLLLLCTAARSQVTLHAESFETDGEGLRYTSNAYSFCPADPDYFLRTNTNPVLPTGGCASGFGSTLTNLQGAFFWAGEDIMSSQLPFPGNHAPGQITTQNINIAGYNALTVSLYLATASNDGARWETDDSINIQVKIDGGSFQTVGRFMGDAVGGGRLRIDGNLDGAITGADPLTNCDTVAFTKYTFTIPGGGTTLTVRLDFDQLGGTEESAVDLIEVKGTLAPCTAPTITCPIAQSIVMDGNCQAILPNYTALGSVTGPCSPTVTQSPLSGSLQSGAGPLTVTLTATNTDLQTASCNFTVNKIDAIAPTMICPASQVVNAGPTCTAVANFTTTATDNCSAATVSFSSLSGSTFALGISTITAVATDIAGNTAACSFTISVIDVTPPTVTCAPNVTINATSGLCTGTTTLTSPTGSDNCGNINPNALNFDGVDDFVDLNTLDFASGEYAIEGWVNTTYAGTNTSSIFNVFATTSNTSTYVLAEMNASTGILRFLHRPQGGQFGGTNLFSPAPINDGQWHHFAVGRGTDTFLRMYVDGVLVASSTTGTTSIPAGPTSCVIGKLATDTRYFTGTLDEIAVWTTERTQSQIQAEMNAEHPVQPGLVALYHLNQGIAGGNNAGITNAADASGNAQTGALYNFALNGPTSNWVSGQTFGLALSGNNAPSTFPVGSTTVTWTLADPSGNTGTCSHTVMVIDQQGPSVTCPAAMTVSTSANTCDAIVNYAMPSAIDNCGIASLSLVNGLASGSTFGLGMQMQTFIAADAGGLADTCSFTITVVDAVAPAVLCQNITVSLDANGLVTVPVAAVDLGTTDNCGLSSLALDITNFDCSDLGTQNVVLTGTDMVGNSSTCTAAVLVVDSIPPVVICQPDTLYLDAQGNATLNAGDINGGSTDLCGLSSFALDFSNFDCSSLGTQNVVLTGTDMGGNTSTCATAVLVVDSTPPVAICQSVTLYLDALGNASLNAGDLDGGSTDNCGISTQSASPNAFTAANLGANAVVLTVTDVAGNTSTCTSTVTLQDTLVAVDEPMLGQILFSASPNPAQDRLQVQVECKVCGIEDALALQLWGMNGQLLRTLPVTNDRSMQRLELDLSGLAAGSYMLSLRHNGRVLTRRVVKL